MNISIDGSKVTMANGDVHEYCMPSGQSSLGGLSFLTFAVGVDSINSQINNLHQNGGLFIQLLKITEASLLVATKLSDLEYEYVTINAYQITSLSTSDSVILEVG